MEKTTIQINGETLERLKAMKRHSRESHDETLNFIIDEVGEDELTDEEIEEIKQGLEEVKQGKIKSIEEVAKELDISLV